MVRLTEDSKPSLEPEGVELTKVGEFLKKLVLRDGALVAELALV